MEPITGPITAPPAPQQTSGSDDIFSSESFLQLLAAQIRGQNPIEPLSDTEFVAQMAQFSQLEQTTAMRERMDEIALGGRIADGAALLGRTVDYRVAESGATLTGVVESLTIGLGGQTTLVVDGVSVPLDAVAVVRQ